MTTNPPPQVLNSEPAQIAVIGAAASGIFTLALAITALKNSAPHAPFTIHVYDPNGFSGGLAYNTAGPFALNQNVAAMEVFHEGDPNSPKTFLSWLHDNQINAKPDTFVTRALYGGYLKYLSQWIDHEVKALGSQISLHTTKVTALQKGVVEGQITVEDATGTIQTVDQIILATGHRRTKLLCQHPQLIETYGRHFAHKLRKLSQSSAPITLVGFGAAASDIISALDYYAFKGRIKIISPHGFTGWLYNPRAEKPTNKQKLALTHAAECHIDIHHKHPANAIRTFLAAQHKNGIAPQFALAALLNSPSIVKNPALHRAVKVFYGNPLRPEHFDLLTKGIHSGRIEIVPNRVDKVARKGRHLRLMFRNAKFHQLSNRVINCSSIGRGATPDCAIIKMLDRLAADFSKTLQLTNGQLVMEPLDGLAVIAVGPLTNANRNGIETFTPGYMQAAEKIVKKIWRCAERGPVHTFANMPTTAAAAVTPF